MRRASTTVLTPEPSSTTVLRSAKEISVATVASPAGDIEPSLQGRKPPSRSGRRTSQPCISAQFQWWVPSLTA
jgi:hypothetical protein